MGKISLVISAILSLIVTILNLTDHRYINGTFMGVIFVFTLNALIAELKNKPKK